MPFFLRKIKKIRWKTDNEPWLNSGELQADCLSDMVTSGNKLSVYRIIDDKSNLKRVVAALAANCDYLSNLDYLLLKEELLQTIGIKSEETNGTTSDELVNSWHIDLVEISLPKLVNLANTVSKYGEIERIPEINVKQFLAESFRDNYFDRKIVRLKPKEVQEIEKLV